MTHKNRVILTIIVSILMFGGVIVLTNDYFDDLKAKNYILIGIVLVQTSIGLYNLYINPISKKEITTNE